MTPINNKIRCPHCNKWMDNDMIYLHIRDIYGNHLHKCPRCNFSTNEVSYAEHHKKETGHTFENYNGKRPQLEAMINAGASALLNFHSNNNCMVDNIQKQSATLFYDKKIMIRKRKISNVDSTCSDISLDDDYDNFNGEFKNNENNIIQHPTLSVTSNIEKFFKSTIIEINNMAIEYRKDNFKYKHNEFLRFHFPGIKEIKKIKIPISSNDKNEIIKCLKCKKSVNKDYVSRRNHIFQDHIDDIRKSIIDIKHLKKTDILTAGFKIIKSCFRRSIVCSDFQCIKCGINLKSKEGKIYHVGSYHQNIFIIKCPIKNCNFKTGNVNEIKSHFTKHGKEFNYNDNDKLFSTLPKDVLNKFESDCVIGRCINQILALHYFPINEKYYKNFDEDINNVMDKFENTFLLPYVLDHVKIKDNSSNENEYPEMVDNDESIHILENDRKSNFYNNDKIVFLEKHSSSSKISDNLIVETTLEQNNNLLRTLKVESPNSISDEDVFLPKNTTTSIEEECQEKNINRESRSHHRYSNRKRLNYSFPGYKRYKNKSRYSHRQYSRDHP